MTNNEADYDMCFRSEGVVLPANGYFGVSAATGGLADDHDVIHFLTSSLHAPGSAQSRKFLVFNFSYIFYYILLIFVFSASHITQEDQVKLSQEYKDYAEKLEQQKEDYRKSHPDEVLFHS